MDKKRHISKSIKKSKKKNLNATSAKKRNKQKKLKHKAMKKKRIQKKRQQRKKQIWKDIRMTVLVTLTIICCLRLFFVSFPKVEGYSMLPILNDEERVFVNKRAKIERFSLIYFKNKEKNMRMIRRVIALPGEQMTYKKDQLYINGTEVRERFIESNIQQSQANELTFTEDFSVGKLNGTDVTLSEKKYFVLGDNRPYSVDSRNFGYVDEKDIIGVVQMRILPLHMMEHF